MVTPNAFKAQAVANCRLDPPRLLLPFTPPFFSVTVGPIMGACGRQYVDNPWKAMTLFIPPFLARLTTRAAVRVIGGVFLITEMFPCTSGAEVSPGVVTPRSHLYEIFLSLTTR